MSAWRDFRYAIAGVADDNARINELAMVGDVDELIALAVTAAKLGLREEEIYPMARHWYLTRPEAPNDDE